ncbi:XAC2610-related protein [Lacrimispora sp.]|jgi:hypothetical protein|uniref:XAC2610-related protein n=1 Tax=Lacrimispora sp. TaxID=2719234 RepID=UPI00289779D4|nr:hypothetical protein [Lacrimispora sp.]
MYIKSLGLKAVLCCCVGTLLLTKFNLFTNGMLKMDTANNYDLESTNVLDITTMEMVSDSGKYIKRINVPATDQMPALRFELTGRKEKDDYNENLSRFFHYPDKLLITTDGIIIQQLDFDENDFSPCALDDFGFEYGDFRFDGYGGFKILCSSMGKNPVWKFWVWDENKKSFVNYPDLEMAGYINFDYNNQEINVSSSGGGDLHEFLTYKYDNDKLILIEKVIDADQDGKRKVFKLIDGELQLTETTESQLK